MRFTVTGYKDYVLDDNGNGVSGIYPAFGFWKKYGLCFAFGGADQNIRREILKHGTSIPVKGDYSFRWLDIDAGQRFGIRLLDGTLAGRYAMKSCSAYYQNDFPRFDQYLPDGECCSEYRLSRKNRKMDRWYCILGIEGLLKIESVDRNSR